MSELIWWVGLDWSLDYFWLL